MNMKHIVRVYPAGQVNIPNQVPTPDPSVVLLQRMFDSKEDADRWIFYFNTTPVLPDEVAAYYGFVDSSLITRGKKRSC